MKDAIKLKRQTSIEEPGELVGVQAAAAILGVERTRIARYIKSGEMPEPFVYDPSGPDHAEISGKPTRLWLRSEVEGFRDRRAAEH